MTHQIVEKDNPQPLTADQSMDATTLPVPHPSKYRQPRWILRWTIDAMLSWFSGRTWKAAAISLIPFLMLMGFVVILPFIMSHPSHYVEVWRNADENKDDETATIALRRLIHEYPNSNTYRYELAKQYFKTKEYRKAIGLLNAIAPVSEEVAGFGPAHLNLVELADDDSVEFIMSPDRRVFHLRKAFESDPDSPKTNQLLGLAYLQMKQPRLAESHLASIAARSPELLFHFANLESQLGKDAQALKAARRAEQLISTRVAQQPGNVEARFLKAKILLTLGRGEQGERELVELYRVKPDDTSSVLAEYYVMYAKSQFGQSTMYRDNAALDVGRALQLQPNSVAAANLLVQLADAGATIPPEVRRNLLSHWEKRCTERPSAENLAIWSQVQLMNGDDTTAIETMQTAAKASSQYRDLLAEMLVDGGRQDEARAIISELRMELRQYIDGPSAAATRYRLARLEQLDGNYAEAISLLSAIEQPSLSVRRELVQAIIDESRQREPADALVQLADAMDTLPNDARLLSRICSMAQEHPEVKSRCREAVLEYVADGRLPAWRAYAAFGTAAVAAEDFDGAINDLMDAVRISKRKGQRGDPITLNNLAVATSRSTNPNANAGLKAIDMALEMLPNQPDLLTTKGEVLVVGMRWEAAIEVLGRALSTRPDNKFVHLLLSKAYTGIGNQELAAQHHRRGLQE